MLLILSLLFPNSALHPKKIPGALRMLFHLSSTGGTSIEFCTLHIITLTEGRCGCRDCEQHDSEDRGIVGTSKKPRTKLLFCGVTLWLYKVQLRLVFRMESHMEAHSGDSRTDVVICCVIHFQSACTSIRAVLLFPILVPRNDVNL